MKADVVIVGLGPVGAVAANLAGAAGFDVLVIDRDLAPFAQPRAIVFDAEIMRVLSSIGLAEAVGAITKPLGGSVYLGADGRPIRTFRSPGPAHAHAYAPSNLFYQPQLETVMRDGLTRFPNVQVRAGAEVTDLALEGEEARLTVRDRGERDFEVQARHVLACDGASSTLRKRLAVRLDDIGFEERWLVVDAHMRGPMRWPEDTYDIPPEVRDGRYSLMICDPAGPATLIPGRGDHRRWEYMLSPGETDAKAQHAARLKARIGLWADPDEVEIVRSAVHRFRALIAQEWRRGPVFLLGDAAHQTPPFFGQGMCHGVRDAAQLMWKLRLVADGRAAPGLLDTYQVEREPHLEAEFGVIVDHTPLGVSAQEALTHVRLLVIVNDWSLRAFGPGEMKGGFGFLQAKPPSALSMVAVTPDELGAAWRDGRIGLRLRIQRNDELFGEPDGSAMTYGFGQLIAHAAKTRDLCAGTVIGSGTVSNFDAAAIGSGCVAERKALDQLDPTRPPTAYLRFGERVRLEAFDDGGRSVFGAMEHVVQQRTR